MKTAIDKYWQIYSDFDYSEVDLLAIEKHINNIKAFAETSKNALAIYDCYKNVPIYMTDTYKYFFGDDIDTIHPDDEEAVWKSSIIAMQYFFKNNICMKEHLLIRRYRIKVKDNYRVILEQVKPLEFDIRGRVFLTLITVEISPNQIPPLEVEYKIFNYKTCDIISPVDDYLDGRPILSERETEVLRLIAKGLLSKEISDKLSISIHTVSKHRQRILEKLKVDTSIEAIKYAMAMGLL